MLLITLRMLNMEAVLMEEMEYFVWLVITLST